MGYTKIDDGGRTSRGIIYDGKGRGMVMAKAGEALTAKHPCRLGYDEDGREALTINNAGTAAFTAMMGVPETSRASGEYGWFIVEGPVDGVVTPSLGITAGHALGVTDGAVTDIGAAFSYGATEWAVCRTTGSAAETYDIYVVPREITAAT